MSRPLISVVGTTGVGKSNLAVQLAKKLKGHIINGDSMQVYKGLDIVVNKPDCTELASAPHYLFDFIEPSNEYSVAEYTRDALKTIESIQSKNEVPIVVGGTNYYIQSLLWKEKIIETAETPGLSNKLSVSESCHESVTGEIAQTLCELLENTDPRLKSADEINSYGETAPLHETLKIVDPVMAKRWHPRDIRKIRRSLEVYYTTGQRHSDWYEQQKTSFANQEKLRFPTCVFWLYGKPAELYPRLDARVDQMIEKGMFKEMEDLLNEMSQGNVIGLDSQYTRGILQAIGFKEFKDYFAYKNGDDIDSVQLEKLRSTGVEQMKIATRQYAKRQVAWLKNKLIPQLMEEHEKGTAAVYLIDATDADAVDDKMIDKVYELALDFLARKPNHETGLLSTAEINSVLLNPKPTGSLWDQYTCDVCIHRPTGKPKVLNGEDEWHIHLNSNGHKTAVNRVKRKADIEQILANKNKA